MGDNDKPFVCSHPGCNMRFTLEDHLSVHRMKHEMSLSLSAGAKPGSFLFADQTPTPTKFLKNCEEIGLFNELNHKNPFEEAFKKAAEIDPKIIPDGLNVLQLPIGALDPDTLHTPTPHLAFNVHASQLPLQTPDHLNLATTPSKEFVPLPGPENDMGSTIAITPGGSSTCGTPRSGSRKSGTPAGTPTSSSTMGLPFKLKLKREPLGENELSQLPGGVVSPSVPWKSPLSQGREERVGASVPVSSVGLLPGSNSASNVATSVMVTETSTVLSAPPTTTSYLVNNGVASTGKDAQYFLQVMIQMPSGEMMPVQIPAALSSASSVPAAGQALTSPARSSAPVSSVTSPLASLGSPGLTTTIMTSLPSELPFGPTIQPKSTIVHPSGTLVPGGSLTQLGGSLIQPASSLVYPGGSVVDTGSLTLQSGSTVVQPSTSTLAVALNTRVVGTGLGQSTRVVGTGLGQSLQNHPGMSSAPISTIVSTVSPSASANVSSLTKQKLKAALQQSVLSSNLRVMSEAVERVSTDPMMRVTTETTGAVRPHTLLKFNSQPSPSSSSINTAASTPVTPDDLDYTFMMEDDEDGPLEKRSRRGDDDPDERRKKFLERNRAAAARCRMKKKNWIGNLEKKADDLQGTNSKLQQEVTLLRSEVAQLKTLLLAHKDCPITIQLQNAALNAAAETQYSSISSTSHSPVALESTAVSECNVTRVPISVANSRPLQSMTPIVIEIKPEKLLNK